MSEPTPTGPHQPAELRSATGPRGAAGAGEPPARAGALWSGAPAVGLLEAGPGRPAVASPPATPGATGAVAPGPGLSASDQADPGPVGPEGGPVLDGPGARPLRAVAVLNGMGQAMCGLGVLLLAFFAFQLWGTNVLEGRAQHRLADQLDRAIQQQREVAAQGEAPAGGASAQLPAPVPGAPVARIRFPSLGAEETVVEGVGRVELRNGPGHNPGSPLPGHRGNVAIAGHRTTHGAPFADLDRLQPGDPIELDTVEGHFSYRVVAQDRGDGAVSGYQVVAPDDVAVIADRGDNRLTLTSCYPRYSDRQRLVVTALLDGPPVDPAPGPLGPFPGMVEPSSPAGVDGTADGGAQGTIGAGAGAGAVAGAPGAPVVGEPPVAAAPPAAGTQQLGWQWGQLPGTLAWALAAALTTGLMALARRRRVHWILLAVSPILLLELAVCFVHIDRMLPSY